MLKVVPWLVLLLSAAGGALGQGTLVYDQESTSIIEGGSITQQQQGQPLGQSFTPSLSSVGFVQFYLTDVGSTSAGATVYVNLLANSITGTILGTTAELSLPNQFGGVATFYFPSQLSVTPGVMYYVQPFVQTGDPFLVQGSQDTYMGGSAYYEGATGSADYWFTEGIVATPEPSVGWLALLGGGVFFAWRRWQTKQC